MLSAFVTVVCFAKGTNYLGLATTFDEFTRSGAIIGKKSNQIKSNQVLSSITRGVVTQSPEPAHVLCLRTFRVELEFRSAGLRRGENRSTRGKNSNKICCGVYVG